MLQTYNVMCPAYFHCGSVSVPMCQCSATVAVCYCATVSVCQCGSVPLLQCVGATVSVPLMWPFLAVHSRLHIQLYFVRATLPTWGGVWGMP